MHHFDHARAGHARAPQAGGCRGAALSNPCLALYVSVARLSLKRAHVPFLPGLCMTDLLLLEA